MSRLLLSAAFVLLFATPSFAQGFLSPIDSISPKQPSYVITVDGKRIEGTIPMASFMNSTLRSFTLKTDGGEKIRFKAADVKLLANKPSSLAKLGAMSDQIDSAFDMITADWQDVMEREWVLFKQALLPGKSKKYALLQLINPGFDSRMQVFFDAKAANNDDTVMGISTAPAESYIVVKDGKRSIQVKKGNYRKLWEDLFGDSPEVLNSTAGKKPKFKNFASHVYAFDKQCGRK